MRPIGFIILRRLLMLIPILIGITLLTFIFIHVAPGNPALSVLGVHASLAQIHQFEVANGLTKPLVAQYVNFLSQALQGHLGTTLVTGQPVSHVIATALPVTAQLTIFALILAVIIGFPLGAISAYRQGGYFDRFTRLVSVVWVAAPSFWLALLAIELFAVRLGVLPSGGYVSFASSPGQWFLSMILPAASLGFPVGGMLARVVRAAFAQELQEDYVRSARGLGVSDLRIVARFIPRNALAAPLTVLGLQVGFLLSGAVLIETIFSLPGVGQVLINSVQQGDLATVQGIVVVAATLFVLVNLAVDIVALLLDPRVVA